MSICTDCKKRPTCTSLCSKAEKYVNQDYRYQREALYTENFLDLKNQERIGRSDPTWQHVVSYFTEENVNFPFLTKLQNKILKMFYFDGLSYAKIAIAMSGNNKGSMSRRAVKHQLTRARADIVSFFNISKEK